MYGDLKIAFVHKVLADYMQEVIVAMRRQIIRRDVRVTDELLNSLAYKVYQQAAQGNANLNFAEWGRMIDMGVGRAHPLSGLTATAEAIAEKSDKHTGRKPKKIYSPIAYGKLNGLIGDLLYGFTEETMAVLKQNIDNGTTL